MQLDSGSSFYSARNDEHVGLLSNLNGFTVLSGEKYRFYGNRDSPKFSGFNCGPLRYMRPTSGTILRNSALRLWST